MKKLISLLMAATMTASLLAGCGGGTSSEQAAGTTAAAAANKDQAAPAASSDAAGETVKIGALYPLSGDVAAIGANIMRGVEFAVEEINGAGGIGGRQIEIVQGDTQGDSKIAMSEAERLITQENVVAILGAYQSGVTEVVSQTTESYKVPLVTAISTADQLTTHNYEYFFRLAPSNMMFLRDMIQYLADIGDEAGKEIKTIAVCADNTLLGQETSKWAQYWAKENGIEFVGEVLYTKGAADLSTEVLQLKSMNPDALVVDNYISDGILLTKTMVEQGYKPEVMIAKATAYIDPSYIPAVGAAANGITTAAEFNPGAKGKEITDAFKAKYDVDMNGHSAESYTAMWVLKTAIEQASAVEREAVKDSLSTLKIEGSFPGGSEIILPYDVIEFSDTEFDGVAHKNTNTGTKLTILQIQDGKYETVWPFDIATAKPQIPAAYE